MNRQSAGSGIVGRCIEPVNLQKGNFVGKHHDNESNDLEENER